MIYSIINYFRFTVKGLRLECDGVYDIETGLLYDYFVPAIEETKTKTCNVQKKVVTENVDKKEPKQEKQIKYKDYTTFDKDKEFHIRAVIKHTFDYTEILTDDTDNEIKEGRTYEFVDHTGYIFEVIDTTRTGNGSLIRISFLSMDIYRIAVLVTELTPGDKFKLK